MDPTLTLRFTGVLPEPSMNGEQRKKLQERILMAENIAVTRLEGESVEMQITLGGKSDEAKLQEPD